MSGKLIHYERTREYPMAVGEAWRLLADTDHLNRAIGLPAMTFSPMDEPREDFTRDASARAFGVVQVRWKEYPFDWVRERRYAVRRVFEGGPIDYMIGGIELAPAGAGTRVSVYADFMPRNLAGRFLWRAGARTVDAMIAFCDRYLQRRERGEAEPVPRAKPSHQADPARVDRILALLPPSVDAALRERVRELVVSGSDDEVVRIRPFALADRWGAGRDQVLSLFLHGTRAGLFELRWELMCPTCRVPKQEAARLIDVANQFHCDTCGIAYAADFDRRVELRFSVHPAVRDALDRVYCIGGPLRMPHVIAQQYLAAQERRPVRLELDQPLRLRAVGGANALSIMPSPRDEQGGEVRLTYAAGRWNAPHSRVAADGDIVVTPNDASLLLQNQTGGPLLAVLEEVEWAGDVTTAAQASTLQEFRDLFASEVLAPGQELAVRDVAMLFSDLKGSTSMYEGAGDAAAYSLVNRHFDFMRAVVAEHRGTVVKSLGDGLMCAFYRMEDAVAAALEAQSTVTAWCTSQAIDPALLLKIGVHHGPAIARTENDVLDYFGRTVNIAARLAAESDGGDVVLLQAAYDQLPESPDGAGAEVFSAQLRGIEGEARLVRLTPTTS